MRRREEEKEDVHRGELLVGDTSFADSTEQEERRIKRKQERVRERERAEREDEIFFKREESGVKSGYRERNSEESTSESTMRA